MPPAVIAGGIAAAGTIGGAVLSSKAQKSAAKTASNAEIQMQQQNLQLAREFQQQNQGNLQPWLNSGTRANALVDSFIYGPQTAAPATGTQAAPQTQAPNAGQMDQWATSAMNALAREVNPGIWAQVGHISDPSDRLAALEPLLQRVDRQVYSQFQATNPRPTVSFPSNNENQGPVNAAPQNPMGGWDAFKASPYYTIPLGEGMRQLNTGLASRGMIESGDAIKSAIRYGQDYNAGRLNEFLGMAERQSDRGIQAGSAIAGVGSNALASMSQSNAAIGNSMANRAIANGKANANMWSGIAGGLGTIFGGMGRSSYGY